MLVIALIPIYYFASRIGKSVPGVAPDIVVAAVGATTVVVLAFLLTQRRAARAGVHHRGDADLRHRGPPARPGDLELRVAGDRRRRRRKEVRWIETHDLGAVLTAFCSLLFPYGLNLPLQLWPRF